MLLKDNQIIYIKKNFAITKEDAIKYMEIRK